MALGIFVSVSLRDIYRVGIQSDTSKFLFKVCLSLALYTNFIFITCSTSVSNISILNGCSLTPVSWQLKHTFPCTRKNEHILYLVAVEVFTALKFLLVYFANLLSGSIAFILLKIKYKINRNKMTQILYFPKKVEVRQNFHLMKLSFM